MLAWSPILVRKIEIHALGFALLKLQLNRHRAAEVAIHRHPHAQLILYLSGEGVQRISGRRRAASTGDLFVIPAGAPHGFSLSGRSRPVSVVLDYELAGRRVRAGHRRLPVQQLNELHTLLSRVPAKGRLTLADYPTILAVVAQLLGPVAGVGKGAPIPTTLDRVRPLLQTPLPLARVARETGYDPDHLTRKLKRECGLGLRALRDRDRLARAQAALRRAATIGDAASESGFEDPGYFARWFRARTGKTPGEFRCD